VFAFVFALLSFQSPATLQHISTVSAAIAPFAAVVAVIIAVVSWEASARATGEEARKTERENRQEMNKAHRGLMRARLLRVYAIVEECSFDFKPYIPEAVERFVVEAEEVFWDKDTFAAFRPSEQETIRLALDYVRLDNGIAMRWVQAGRERHEVCECFLSALERLERAFRDGLNDDETADRVRTTWQETRELAEARSRPEL